MTAMPNPDRAARTPRGRRRPAVDARLIVGVLLVAASVAGVVSIVTAADQRLTVYAAGATLIPGDRIDAGDLRERSVALDAADAMYLRPGDLPVDALVVTSVIREGELVPRAAVGSAASDRATTIVLELGSPVSESVAPGALVDVWSAALVVADGAALSGRFEAPAVLTADAIVVRVLDDDQLVSAGGGASVEVRIPRARVARLLQAVANGDALAVVPAGLALDGGGVALGRTGGGAGGADGVGR